MNYAGVENADIYAQGGRAKRLQAEWRTDDSQPMTIIAALVVIVTAILAVPLLYRTGRLFRATEKRGGADRAREGRVRDREPQEGT